MKRVAITALLAASLVTPMTAGALTAAAQAAPMAAAAGLTPATAQAAVLSASAATTADCAKLRQASRLVEGPAKRLLAASRAGTATKAMGDALAASAQKAVDLLATIKSGDAKVPASALLIDYLQYTVAGPDPTEADLQGARPLGYSGTKALCGFYPYL